jgi:hypothetical protein
MAGTDAYDGDGEPACDEEVRRWRRAVLFDSAKPPAVDKEVDERKVMDTLLKLLKRNPTPATAEATDHGEPQVRVFCIIRGQAVRDVAREVYENPSLSTFFDCKVYVRYDPSLYYTRTALAKILEEITGVQNQSGQQYCLVDEDVDQLAIQLQQHLQGKRILIVIVFHRKNYMLCDECQSTEALARCSVPCS